jgi:hypothetical protein
VIGSDCSIEMIGWRIAGISWHTLVEMPLICGLRN